MTNELDPVEFPELVVATAGPIGVDMDLISSILTACFQEVEYTSSSIKLSAEMEKITIPAARRPTNLHELYHWKIDYANALRRRFQLPDLLARVAILNVRAERHRRTGGDKKPASKTAYIISQLKRPEEVELFRKVYGRQFILVSAYASEVDRHERLSHKLRKHLSTDISEAQIRFEASKLIERDANEDVEFGQRLRDTFHLGDVFIDGLDRKSMEHTLRRFVQALFGRSDITPSKSEYGMYAARSASLRSADLSRQVGAAVFSTKGEQIVLGCNEVPKAGGGTYWDMEEPDHRDVKKGYDPNEERRREILRDLIERMRKGSLLSHRVLKLGSDGVIADELITKGSEFGVLSGAWLMDLTEYGRIVHAEMSALCDAARLGRSVKDGILYCTTFPCHNCTKHILAAGISKVVFLEPYPKSQAKQLHGDEIEIETENDPARISFIPFLGISPFRYRDIFAKGKRKKDGEALVWYRGAPKPMLDVVFPSYTTNEVWALAPLIGDVKSRRQEEAPGRTRRGAGPRARPQRRS